MNIEFFMIWCKRLTYWACGGLLMFVMQAWFSLWLPWVVVTDCVVVTVVRSVTVVVTPRVKVVLEVDAIVPGTYLPAAYPVSTAPPIRTATTIPMDQFIPN
jgi:hypothetical protein